MDLNYRVLVESLDPASPSYKYDKYRLLTLVDYLARSGHRFDEVDMADYVRFLTRGYGLAASTANAHEATSRSRYRKLLEDGTFRTVLEELLGDEEEVEQALERIRQVIALPRVGKKRKKMAPARPQIDMVTLLHQPDRWKLAGARDMAIIALTFTTGLRENELCRLQVDDLRQKYRGELALYVRPGIGSTERHVPYGKLMWGLELTEEWLKAAGIDRGPVFRGFYKGGETIRPTELSPRGLEHILGGYPIEVDGQMVTATPMDLRRAYARLLFEAGVDPEDIMANLGITDGNAFLNHIGPKDASLNSPPGIDFFDRDTLGL